MSNKKVIWSKIISLISISLPAFSSQGQAFTLNSFLNDLPSQKPTLFLNPVGYFKNFLFAGHSSHRSHSSHSSHSSGSYHRSHVSHTSARSGYHSSHVSHTSSYGSSYTTPDSNSSESLPSKSYSPNQPEDSKYTNRTKQIEHNKYSVQLVNGSTLQVINLSFDKNTQKLSINFQGGIKADFYLKDIYSIKENATGKIIYEAR